MIDDAFPKRITPAFQDIIPTRRLRLMPQETMD
jgi:hypothetical protein